jgi:hypothetical protein
VPTDYNGMRGALLDPVPTPEPRPPIRQSWIGRFDNCALSLLLQQQAPVRQPSNLAARGQLFHRWVAWAIAMMRAQGMAEMPVDMAMAQLLVVVAQRDVEDDAVVHLPMKELQWLRVLVVKWCQGGGFNAQRVIAIEERLEATIRCPDGRGGWYDRVISGRPDVLVADPPDGIIVPDWKSGWAPPGKLGAEDAEAHGKNGDKDETLSDQGYAQQVVYGALVLANYPAINRVTLRESYIMWGEYREATIDRYNLERVLDVLGTVVAQIDQAMDAGPTSSRWIPTAGTHCAMCPAPQKCPIKDWEGIPATEEEALQIAGEWIVAAQVRKSRLPLIKGWVDVHGNLEIDHGKGRRQVGWKEWDGNKDDGSTIHKGRGPFQMFEPVDAPESPWDERLAEAMRSR